MHYAAPVDAELSRLGVVVRELRTERRWTLDHAAARLGISRRLLAQIEAGDANPSLSTLLSIAAGFDVHLTDLLATEPTPTSVIVQAELDDAPVMWSTPEGSAARLLVGRGPLELWSWTLAPGDRRASDAHHAESMETIHVQRGTIEVELGGEVVRLGRGASALFSADQPHAYRNPTKRPAEFMLSVFDPAD